LNMLARNSIILLDSATKMVKFTCLQARLYVIEGKKLRNA